MCVLCSKLSSVYFVCRAVLDEVVLMCLCLALCVCACGICFAVDM